ncbi:ERI1 exoribonuclease 3 [Balamuthia mandrillaris]
MRRNGGEEEHGWRSDSPRRSARLYHQQQQANKLPPPQSHQPPPPDKAVPLTNLFSALSLAADDHKEEEVSRADGVVEAQRRESVPQRRKRLLLGLEQKNVKLVGRVWPAVVTGFTLQGFLVNVEVCAEEGAHRGEPQQSARQGSTEEATEPQDQPPEVVVIEEVLIKWTHRTRAKWRDPQQLLRETRRRLLAGTRFKVYIEGYNENGANLKAKLAMHSDPVILLPPIKPSALPTQRFRYLVIIDLEATCDYGPTPLVHPALNAEIIEFPWVVLDTTTFEIVHSERYYVRPECMQCVTPYTTALTGISPDTLEKEGISLHEALLKFKEFVEKWFPQCASAPQCTEFRVLTDGIWDVQVQLRLEAQRKQLPLEWWYEEYFNLKTEFQRHYPYFAFKQTAGPALVHMVKALGLEFVGRHHSGLDDCYTISTVVKALILQGHKLAEPRVVAKDYDPINDKEWTSFEAVISSDSWRCPNEECQLWNRPHVRRCPFCKLTVRPEKDAL